MAIIHAQNVLWVAMRALLVVRVLHALQHTVTLAEARDCGCTPSAKWVCGVDGKWYSLMCQAMCDGVQGGFNRGGCNGIQECEEACLGRTTLPIKPGAPDYCWPICPFPPYPPIGYNVKVDGPDVCKTYRAQCGAVCAATYKNPIWGFKKNDVPNFNNRCYENCNHHVGRSMWGKDGPPDRRKVLL